MTAQTDTYDGTHYQIVLMNMRDGSVQGHAEGCADLKRGVRKFAEPSQADEAWDVLSKEEAREGYNADFDEETDGWYDIDWKPCADHVPATHEVVEAAPVKDVTVTSKKGSKWTYIYVGGDLVAEVRNDQVGTVLDFFQKR